MFTITLYSIILKTILLVLFTDHLQKVVTYSVHIGNLEMTISRQKTIGGCNRTNANVAWFTIVSNGCWRVGSMNNLSIYYFWSQFGAIYI